ncbi:MAG: GNAT family N-acetyltransferase [Alphaproteobacteria bacterium]
MDDNAPAPGAGLVVAPLADHPEHVDLVVDWNFRFWGPVTARSHAGYVERVRGYLSRGPLPIVLVALADGKPAGTVSVNLDDMSTRPDLGPWVANLYVDPAFRGRGVGSALVRAAEDAARAAGHARIFLYTPDQERMYTRLGWRVIDRDVYDGEDVAVMTKDL